MTATRKIRIGVAGGNFGAQFYWNKHPNCEVAAVCDFLPHARERLAKVYECSTTFERFEDLIADKNIDAIAVFTPVPDHVRHSISAMRAGKHVICAVPAAMTLEECQQLRDAVKSTGQTYMLAETSYYYQATISARKFHQSGAFGRVFYMEGDYHHPHLDSLFFDSKGNRTWRYGFPPMHYPTHCTSFVTGVTGERFVRVSAAGWGNDSPILKDNVYKNPFWCETGFFITDRGNSAKISLWWDGATEEFVGAKWFGEKMSLTSAYPGAPPRIIRTQEKGPPKAESFEQPNWWQTEMLPPSMRFDSGHDGSHCFLAHEFISALVENRKPAIDVYEAIAYTAPGIVAHQSALKDGESMSIPSFD